MNYLLSSVDVATDFLSPEPHPDTIAFAKKLIDEMQASAPNPKISSKVPQVPSFHAPPIQQKMSAQELFGSSDSEAVSDFDFKDVGGGQSDSFEEDNRESPEETYSDQSSHHSDSGESSVSNYESTSSFEARKQKSHKRTSHGSATSKAAAAGRKKKMMEHRASVSANSPQSIYLKNKAPSKRKAPVTPEGSQESSHSESQSDEKGSGNGGSETDSDSPPPAVPKKGKGKGRAAPKQAKSSLPRQRKAAKKDTPPPTDFNENPHRRTKRNSGLPVCRVQEDYEGSQEAEIPVVDSRPGKKRSRAGRTKTLIWQMLMKRTFWRALREDHMQKQRGRMTMI